MSRHRSVTLLRKILSLGRRTEAPVATTRLLTIELVDSRTEIAHRVTDEAFAAGRRDGGRYRTLCEMLVLPASLTAPARSHCPMCERGSAPTRRSGGTRGA